jgi:hypothetical protein
MRQYSFLHRSDRGLDYVVSISALYLQNWLRTGLMLSLYLHCIHTSDRGLDYVVSISTLYPHIWLSTGLMLSLYLHCIDRSDRRLGYVVSISTLYQQIWLRAGLYCLYPHCIHRSECGLGLRCLNNVTVSADLTEDSDMLALCIAELRQQIWLWTGTILSLWLHCILKSVWGLWCVISITELYPQLCPMTGACLSVYTAFPLGWIFLSKYNQHLPFSTIPSRCCWKWRESCDYVICLEVQSTMKNQACD